MAKLAINGGQKVRTKPFPRQYHEMEQELINIKKLFAFKKPLSAFRGNATMNFWGGEQVRKLESEFITQLGYEEGFSALAVNSCTSALQIACGALDLKPGDEVIVSPWSMSCSASAPMLYGAKPVFADIDPFNFCLDQISVEERITKKTKAIITVDLFGHPSNQGIFNLGLPVIEDAAQAIGAKYDGQPVGSKAAMTCFSFTQGKHLTCGEGGMIVTSSPVLHKRCALLRNHCESVIHDEKKSKKCVIDSNNFNKPGFNMRMTEIQAAILLAQLDKLPAVIYNRYNNSKLLDRALISISFIKPTPRVLEGVKHSYYATPYFYYEGTARIPRDVFINAVKAELTEEKGRIDRGVPIGAGYIDPLYNMSLFEKMESLPIVEDLQSKRVFITLLPGLQLTEDDITDIAEAFYKVADNIKELE